MTFLSEMLDRLREEALAAVAARGPDIAAAALVLVVGWWVSKKAVTVAGRPVSMWLHRPSLVKAVLRGIRVTVLLIALLISLSILRVELSGILVSMGIMSAIVALVLAPFVSSWISGFFILTDRPYEIGDMIYLPGLDVTGFVKEITMRYTKLVTLDNSFLVMPNQNMRNKDVVNYSADDIRLRESFDITISYGSDPEEAERALIDAARETDGVLDDGGDVRIVASTYPLEPRVMVNEFADSGISLTLRYWLREPYYKRVVTTRLAKKIWSNFQDRGVEIPYPHRHLIFDRDDEEEPDGGRGPFPGEQ